MEQRDPEAVSDIEDSLGSKNFAVFEEELNASETLLPSKEPEGRIRWAFSPIADDFLDDDDEEMFIEDAEEDLYVFFGRTHPSEGVYRHKLNSD